MQSLQNTMRYISMVCMMFWIVIYFLPAHGAESVGNKEPRPAEDIALETPKETDQKSEEKQEDADKPYVYNPAGKTDPFKSFIAIQEEQKGKEQKKPKTYLETLELSQLDLVMIAISPKGRWAMVRDAKGLGHVIKEGTAIGTNGGVVFKIEPGEVVIREEYMDFRGQKQFREITKKPPSLQ
jgi:Tfp pilus assembly protein PilP